MFYTVYKTTNIVNRKEYIGFHKIDDKTEIISEYCISGSIFKDGYLGSGKLIKRALEKYGPESFSQELLFVSNIEKEASDMEGHFVNEDYIKRDDTYNLVPGGHPPILRGEKNGFYGKRHTKETLEKIQESRTKSYSENPFSWCETFDKASGIKLLSYSDVYNFYNICEEDRNRLQVYRLVYEDKLKYKSDYLHMVALSHYKNYLDWLSKADERAEYKSKITSDRFKGKPKSKKSNEKRSKSLKRYCIENGDKVKERMSRTNRDPEKIRKTAEFHRGRKRSKETCKRISESIKGKEPGNKGKIWIHNSETKEKRYIDPSLKIPKGWKKGLETNGPKGKLAYYNPELDKIKFFNEGKEPEGWRRGRK